MLQKNVYYVSAILTYPNQAKLLNKRSELASKFYPVNKHLVSNYKAYN